MIRSDHELDSLILSHFLRQILCCGFVVTQPLYRKMLQLASRPLQRKLNGGPQARGIDAIARNDSSDIVVPQHEEAGTKAKKIPWRRTGCSNPNPTSFPGTISWRRGPPVGTICAIIRPPTT